MVSKSSKSKKKVKKNIPFGVAHINSTFNNTIITITDTTGNTVSWSSSGNKGFKGSRKSTPFAAQLAAEEAGKKAIEHGMKNIEIIYGNGIDQNDFKMRKDNNFRDKLKFIFVGRLLKDKGINELCAAIQSVGNKAEFTIISPDDKENIASIKGNAFENLKNMDSVQLINKVSHEEIKNIYSKSDVFILPSYREGLPRSALEAMCAGLPLILSDVPGCRECLINGVNGFLIESKSSESIEKAINKFIEKPEIIKKMGEESVNLIRKKFSDQKIFNNYEGIL